MMAYSLSPSGLLVPLDSYYQESHNFVTSQELFKIFYIEKIKITKSF